jgi:lipoate-protein ligase B
MVMSTAVTDWMPGRRMSSALQVSLLGLTDLSAALALQDRIAAELAERRDTYGVLLLCEHPVGVTFGREGSAADLQVDRHELLARGVPVEWLRRGGGAWAHHSGQLMAYFLVPYRRLGLNCVEVRDRLTRSLVEVALEFGVHVESTDSPCGARGRCGQFGFVGAAVRDGISQFGGCINVSVPRGALGLVKWGAAVRPACLAAERMRATPMASVRESWMRHLAAQFGYDRYHLWTGHPWLRRTVRRGVAFVET